MMKHPCRTCLYDEASAVIKLGADKAEVINPQMSKYMDLGFPVEQGLCATGIILRKDCKAVRELMDTWWLEIEGGSHRDQLSLEYAKWIHKADINMIDGYWKLIEREDGKFRYKPHK